MNAIALIIFKLSKDVLCDESINLETNSKSCATNLTSYWGNSVIKYYMYVEYNIFIMKFNEPKIYYPHLFVIFMLFCLSDPLFDMQW